MNYPKHITYHDEARYESVPIGKFPSIKIL